MADESKTKKHLVTELKKLRRRIAVLEKSEAKLRLWERNLLTAKLISRA